MEVHQLRKLRPKLDQFLNRFDDCFPRKDTRAHLPVYVSGQLSDIPEKSVEPIAINAGVPPRTLQEFLSQHRWDHDTLRDDLQKIVRDDHAGPHPVGIFDETSDVKKGDKTPGVQRQWCGAVGKTENCIVTAHLAYARDGFHCLLDGELYLPESWSDDRDRCREAGIPDGMVYRPKWKIALGLYDHAVANGLHFDWLTFDEGYGGKPELLRELSARSQRFVAESVASTAAVSTSSRTSHTPLSGTISRPRRAATATTTYRRSRESTSNTCSIAAVCAATSAAPSAASVAREASSARDRSDDAPVTSPLSTSAPLLSDTRQVMPDTRERRTSRSSK